MILNLRDLLVLDEGRRAKKYRDSLGFWTIAVGHLIDPRKGGGLPWPISDELMRRGIDIWADEAMPEDLIDALLDYDIREHTKLIEGCQPWVAQLDEVRHALMVDMCFNLGPEPFDHDGFKDWPMFIEQVRYGKYEKAAANMLSTTWAKQVGKRATRLAQMMSTGQWPT